MLISTLCPLEMSFTCCQHLILSSVTNYRIVLLVFLQQHGLGSSKGKKGKWQWQYTSELDNYYFYLYCRFKAIAVRGHFRLSGRLMQLVISVPRDLSSSSSSRSSQSTQFSIKLCKTIYRGCWSSFPCRSTWKGETAGIESQAKRIISDDPGRSWMLSRVWW